MFNVGIRIGKKFTSNRLPSVSHAKKRINDMKEHGAFDYDVINVILEESEKKGGVLNIYRP